MVRTIVQPPEDQAVALERAARRRGVSKAALVREALGVLLAREGGDAAVDRALRAAGSGASGVRNLGERHDEYLAAVRRPLPSSTRLRCSPSSIATPIGTGRSS